METAAEKGDDKAGDDGGGNALGRCGAGADCEGHRQGQGNYSDCDAGDEIFPEIASAVAVGKPSKQCGRQTVDKVGRGVSGKQ